MRSNCVSWGPLCLVVAAIALSSGLAARAQTLNDPALHIEATFLSPNFTTGIRFVTVDEFFVIEKETGRVLHFLDGVSTEVLDLDVNYASERGLIGIELHPDFETNGFVYLYFSVPTVSTDTDETDEWLSNDLARYTWNGSALVDETLLFSIPRNLAQDGPNHDGGPMRFGPDGKLYLASGDLNRFGAEQNRSTTSSDTGGIHRFNEDGSVPADNPFNDPAVDPDFHDLFAYGVRNSFGLAFDPVTGLLWDTENGPTFMDEINVVESGFNSGWRPLMGPVSRDGQGDTPADLIDLLPGTSFYSDPEFSFASPIGITSIGFLAGSTLGPSYDDAVWVGDSSPGLLYEFRLNGARDGFVLNGGLADQVADGTAERNQAAVGSDFFVTTDIQLDPADDVTVLSLFGMLYRITRDDDQDGVRNRDDNCVDVANPDQEDFDAGTDDDSSLAGIQHYGDACDADLDNDGFVGASDFFGVFRPCLGSDVASDPQCAPADFDGDGVVAPNDFFTGLRPALGTPPGPGVTEP
ncbi:MAG: PQQ-dependent sugar dehydrogenase [Myxococcota bacterium]|nr:PQQ-dependent sugar dehydrogenase [Myxococcota bacterium]